MQLRVQTRLAGQILKCSGKRVWFDTERLEEIKESITKADLKGLINDGAIKSKPKKGISKVRARKRQVQRRKGKRKGPGSRKGKAGARQPRKRVWIARVRKQKGLIKRMRDKELIDKKTYGIMYNKIKGGFFRSVRHIKLYVEEQGLIKK